MLFRRWNQQVLCAERIWDVMSLRFLILATAWTRAVGKRQRLDCVEFRCLEGAVRR